MHMLEERDREVDTRRQIKSRQANKYFKDLEVDALFRYRHNIIIEFQ